MMRRERARRGGSDPGGVDDGHTNQDLKHAILMLLRRSFSTFRPRRSVLYLPGSNPRVIEKARTLPADSIILDLEDAVAPESKAAARQQVTEAVSKGGFGYRETVIRVNGADTEWMLDDLKAAVKAKPDAILVPKISSADDVHLVNKLLCELNAPKELSLWAMMETPKAVLNALAIASTANETRLRCMVVGTNDLSKETRARVIPGRAPMESWLMTCVAAARTADLDIIDGVYNHISDTRGFELECIHGRDRGFDGKTVVHPSQIELANIVFGPSEAEVAWARKVIDEFAKPENNGRGALQLEGRMVERMHAEMGRRIVTIAEAISARLRP